jgi:N-acetylglucosamine-6-sulfatase
MLTRTARLRAAVVTALAAAAVLALTAASPSQASPPLVTGVRPAVAAAPGQPPNIVMIMTDDQPLERLETMPNVRALLQDRGVTFAHSLIPTSSCCPSRTTMLTGRYSHDTGIYTNRAPGGGWSAFHDSGQERSTLATWLNDAGYRTALVGKYLNDFALADPGYVPPGWDRFAGLLNGGYYYNYELRVRDSSGVTDVAHGNAPGDYSTDVFASYATQFIDSTPADTPLFMMFTPLAPHAPFKPAPIDVGTVPFAYPNAPDINEKDMSDKPAWMQSAPTIDRRTITSRTARQKETLRAVDRAVGQIMTALGPRVSRTLIVFTSDNGLMLGSHRQFGKGLPHARSSEVPLIMRWDGHLFPGSTDQRLALNLDVTATILDAAGVRHPTSGLSLLRPVARDGTVLEGAAGSDPRPAYCAWRTTRWLYVEYSGNQGRELYDYRTDPYELNNLAGLPQYRDRLQRMRDAAQAACDPKPPGFTW